jgi:hypothetical protein
LGCWGVILLVIEAAKQFTKARSLRIRPTVIQW